MSGKGLGLQSKSAQYICKHNIDIQVMAARQGRGQNQSTADRAIIIYTSSSTREIDWDREAPTQPEVITFFCNLNSFPKKNSLRSVKHKLLKHVT